MADRIDPEGKRLPIKLDSTSNGEFLPVPLSGANRAPRHSGSLPAYSLTPSSATTRCTAGRLSMRSLSAV